MKLMARPDQAAGWRKDNDLQRDSVGGVLKAVTEKQDAGPSTGRCQANKAEAKVQCGGHSNRDEAKMSCIEGREIGFPPSSPSKHKQQVSAQLLSLSLCLILAYLFKSSFPSITSHPLLQHAPFQRQGRFNKQIKGTVATCGGPDKVIGKPGATGQGVP
jgi:hypothetical protein